MQSQSSQDSFFSGPLSLLLSKFSYATVHEDSNAPIPWVHLSSRGNLLAVFEKCRVQTHWGIDEESKFRVTNGTEVMEDLSLIALAAEARKATVQNQVSNAPHRPNAVTIIVKKPCVAVRYPSGRGQIRRFQIRFFNDTDYYTAMGRFSEANAPVIEAGTFPIPQPHPRQISSSSSTIHPNNSALHQDARQPPTPPVLLSNQNSTTSFTVLNGAEAFPRRPTSDSLVTQTPTPRHRTPQPLSTGTHNEKDVYAFPQDAPERDMVRSYNETTASQDWKAALPAMQTANQASDVGYPANQMHRTSTVLSAAVPTSSHAPINLYAPRPSTAPAIESQGLTEMLPPKRELPFGKPVTRDGSKPPTTAESIAAGPLSGLKPKADNDHRPSSAQSSHVQELETQSAPPKAKAKRAPAEKAPARVTKKPAAPRSRKKAASICATSQAPARVTKKPAAPRSRKNAASVRAISPVPGVEELLKSPQESAKDVTSVVQTIDTQALFARVDERRAIPADQGMGDKLIFRFEPFERTGQTMNMSSPEEPTPQAGTITPVFEVLDTQESRHCQSQAAPTSAQVPAADIACPAPTPPAESQVLSERPQNLVPIHCEPSAQPSAGPFGGLLASLMQDPDFAGSPDLAHWAKRPEEERRACLETFLCWHMQDENFFNLCEDLNGTWQRIFLDKIV